MIYYVSIKDKEKYTKQSDIPTNKKLVAILLETQFLSIVYHRYYDAGLILL